MAKKVKILLFVFGLVAMSALANFALAAYVGTDFGIEPVNNVINLSTGDPRVIAARIIQFLLSFLGIISLVLIIYAGFVWMTSGGDSDKITQAKRILKNAVIGLFIILSSWAITTFIISQLLAIISGGGENVGGGGGVLIDPGIGAIGSCTVESFYPENGQKDVARNSSIIITFKEKIKIISGVCKTPLGASCTCDGTINCNKIDPATIRIYKNDLGDACASGTCPNPVDNTNITDVIVSVSPDKKTLVLVPTNYLGNPINNVLYSVKITSDLRKDDPDSSSMFKSCYSNYFQWGFEVGTRLDLTPPQVVYGGIFPRPDNNQDIQNTTADPVAAQGSITVNSCPNYYQASAIISVVSVSSSSPAASAVPLNYQGNLTEFTVAIAPTSTSTARLFDGNNNSILLGSADFDSQNNARFGDYFTFHAPNRNLGNSWTVTLSPERLADSLTVGDQLYIFTNLLNQPVNYIYVAPGNCNNNIQASAIHAKVSGNELVSSSHTVGSSSINLMAKVAGITGNNIVVSTTNPAALQITPLAGGKNREDTSRTLDKKDVPMNSVIQINFNEAVNPLQVAGLASEVSDYIRVVNASSSSFNDGDSCNIDSDCKSYACQGTTTKVCLGDYIDGKFLVSNIYRTVEFISDNKCGMNGCGEEIYCLPSNSHIKVEMKSADLKSCNTSADCIAFSPFNTCRMTSLNYRTCQNIDGKNYPTATSTLNGIIDTAINSFDGDRDVYSSGPFAYYNDNFQASSTQNLDQKDSYLWSFYVNDIINLDPPTIESISPVNATQEIPLAEPIEIFWSTLMMNSSLTTGSRVINIGTTSIEHKLLNLWSTSPTGMGYWVANDNMDTDLDGEPDHTNTWLKHSALSASMSYRAQAGSGLKDIYQNCFKPSAGTGCAATVTNPSCCSMIATSTLGSDGNCQ